MLLWLIIACEIGFWILLFSGLFARYLWKIRRTSTALLYSVPLIDVILLVATVLDLSQGSTTATLAHGLAALYIGFSIAYGRMTINWADEWFAYKFAAGPRPADIPYTGWQHIKNEWSFFGRGLLAFTIACALIITAIDYIGDAERTRRLAEWPRFLSVAAFIWLFVGPIHSTLFRRKPPVAEDGDKAEVGTSG